MGLSIEIVGLTPKNSGEEAELKIKISDTAHPERCETKSITVFSKMLFEIGNIGPGSLPYTLTREEYGELEYRGELYGGVKKGLDILAYGDNTKRSLIRKLRERGIDRYIAEDAAEYLEDVGLIDEVSYLERTVKKLADARHYGPSRIKAEIYKKGFLREVIDEHLPEILSEIDFAESAYLLVVKKCDVERLSDMKYRESLYSSMYRYGYSPAETKEAIKKLKANSD